MAKKTFISDLELSQVSTSQHSSSLSAAVASIGSSEKVLLVSENQTVSANLTIPKNITLRIPRGITISVNTGVTLTVDAVIDAGIYQIFAGLGDVVSTIDVQTTEVYPEWFGAKGDFNSKDNPIGDLANDDTTAIQAAIDFFVDTSSGNGGAVKFGAKGYKCTDTITLKAGIALLGETSVERRVNLHGSVLAFRPSSPKRFINGVVGGSGGIYSSYRIENLILYGTGPTEPFHVGLPEAEYSLVGMYLYRFFGIINNVVIRNFQTGFKLEHPIGSSIERLQTHACGKGIVVTGEGGSEHPTVELLQANALL